MAEPADMAESAAIDKALTRQELIWGGLYGPPKAAELVAAALVRTPSWSSAERDLALSATGTTGRRPSRPPTSPLDG